MPPKKLKMLDSGSRKAWRQWLAAHHESESEVWLVFHKRQKGRPSIAYEDAVEEALCFGWIDSLIRRLDDDRYARKFTPRRPGSNWSISNRKRYARLKASGRLTRAGLERGPTRRSRTTSRALPPRLPRYIEDALRRRPAAWDHFASLAPSYRRVYIAWIDSAKQEKTRSRRLKEAVGLLAEGRMLGLK